MKNTDIQNKWDELFDENIENGLSFKVPRRSGKSTWIAHKALKLVLEGKSVAIICMNQNHADTMKGLIKEITHGVLKDSAIRCCNYDYPGWITSEYKLYDECEGLNRPNTCSIFTEQKNIFTFGSDWLGMEIKNRMRSLGTKEFKTQFESNIIKKAMDNNTIEVEITMDDMLKHIYGNTAKITSTTLQYDIHRGGTEFTINGYYND